MAETTSTNATATRGLAGLVAGWRSTLQGILRIGAGLLFMQHGAQKLFGVLGGFGGTPGGTAELFSMMGLAGIVEFFGGLLVVVGLKTRPVALICSVQMIVAYFMAHQPQGGFPIQNGGELALLYAFVFAFFVTAGPGSFSLDGRLRSGSSG